MKMSVVGSAYYTNGDAVEGFDQVENALRTAAALLQRHSTATPS